MDDSEENVGNRFMVTHRLRPSLSNGYIIITLMELRKAKPEAEQLFLFDQETSDKVRSEAPMFKLIKPSVLADRLREEGASRLTDTAAVVVKSKRLSWDCPCQLMLKS
ncbi:unnamed protein product [Eruca vesicaria subsp. sativa]|uniref:40S ribosomal protein S25 n=1 Tax=Eruca vesicaria subsp. sativa TaxID=29727 RepID=A0ABC8JKS0_ERUVS|nr:unnamed protein product [Eruca vesicaria subsp. sativa]